MAPDKRTSHISVPDFRIGSSQKSNSVIGYVDRTVESKSRLVKLVALRHALAALLSFCLANDAKILPAKQRRMLDIGRA